MTGTGGTPAILAPVDGSRFSEAALPLVATVARALNADIHLARVHEVVVAAPMSELSIVPAMDPRIDADLRKTHSQELARTAAVVRTASGRPVHATLLDGPVSVALREHADAVGASLVVMATHGRGGVRRTLFGSVATDLVCSGGHPVLLIRPHDGTPPPAPVRLERVLIPLDGSPLSEAAIAPALWLLGNRGTVTLMRVVSPVTVNMAPTIVPLTVGDPHLLDAEAREAHAAVERIASMLRVRGLTVHVVVVAHPSPSTAITDALNADPPDFVSMATHGRGGVARMLMGSVADTVLRHVNVPVLLLRPGLS